jgi:hypothetical protein
MRKTHLEMCGVEVRLTVERTMGLPLYVLFLLVCCFSDISLILGRIFTLKTIFETGADIEMHILIRSPKKWPLAMGARNRAETE